MQVIDAVSDKRLHTVHFRALERSLDHVGSLGLEIADALSAQLPHFFRRTVGIRHRAVLVVPEVTAVFGRGVVDEIAAGTHHKCGHLCAAFRCFGDHIHIAVDVGFVGRMSSEPTVQQRVAAVVVVDEPVAGRLIFCCFVATGHGQCQHPAQREQQTACEVSFHIQMFGCDWS